MGGGPRPHLPAKTNPLFGENAFCPTTKVPKSAQLQIPASRDGTRASLWWCRGVASAQGSNFVAKKERDRVGVGEGRVSP